MDQEERIAQLEQKLAATQDAAARMVTDLVSALAPSKAGELAAGFDQWAQESETDQVSAELAKLVAAWLRAAGEG